MVALPFHRVGHSAGFCNRHNAGAALVAPRLGGPGTPGAHWAERSTPVSAMLVVDFRLVASAVAIEDEDNVVAAVDCDGTVADFAVGNTGVAHAIIDGDCDDVGLPHRG